MLKANKNGAIAKQLTAKLALQESALPLENFNQKLKMVENHWNSELVNSCREHKTSVKVFTNSSVLYLADEKLWIMFHVVLTNAQL